MKLTYIIIITLFFKISSKEIRFPFKRHYNQKISEIPSQELMKKLHDSNMEIVIEIGSNSLKIPFYLRLDQYSFFTSCSEANIDKNLIKFMEKESTTLEKDSKEYFSYQYFSVGYKSRDNFKFPNKITKKLNFILATDLIRSYNVSGIIGLKNYEKSTDFSIKDYNFLVQLKKLEIINNLDFVLKFSNKDEGELIIGEKPHIYDNNYDEEKFLSVRTLINEDNDIIWGLNFNNISHSLKNGKKNIMKESQKGYFKIKIDGILGAHEYEDLIIDDFKKLINEGKCFTENTISFRYYYCDKNVNMDFIGNLEFEHSDLKSIFTFSKEDLIYYDNKGYQHFLVKFQNGIRDKNWIFGKLFLEKYLLVFNLEDNTIGYYLKGKRRFSGISILVSLLIIIIIFLIFMLYYYIKKIPRKKRSYELEENYDYIPQTGNKLLLSN